MITSFFYFWMPLLLLGGIILYLPFYVYHRRRGIGNWRQAAYFCLFSVGLMILFVTLSGADFQATVRHMNLIPLGWLFQPYSMGVASTMQQLAINFIMFVPFTFFLATVLSRRNLWKVMAIALIVNVSIETFQYFTGRSADIDDLIMNLLGGLCGYGLFLLVHRRLKRKKFWQVFTGLYPKSPLRGNL